MTLARGGTVVDRAVPAQLACSIGARARAGERDARPANVEGGPALFVSPLQGSLVAGSAADGVIYDANGPGAALGLAAAVAAAGSLSLLGRADAAISSPPAGAADPARAVGLGSAGTAARCGRWSRKHRTTTTLKLPFAAIPAAARKELSCPTRL